MTTQLLKNKITPDVATAIDATLNPRVQEIIKELAWYNLGVALPHIHGEGPADLLPSDQIAYESNLQVSFVHQAVFASKEHNGFPVAWRWNPTTTRVEACAWCHDD